MWVHFWDMHSGGRTKQPPFEHIFLEADSEDTATEMFRAKFGHSPDAVACSCCGENYAVSSDETLEAASEYQRRKRFMRFDEEVKPEDLETMEQFRARPDVLVVPLVTERPPTPTGRKFRD